MSTIIGNDFYNLSFLKYFSLHNFIVLLLTLYTSPKGLCVIYIPEVTDASHLSAVNSLKSLERKTGDVYLHYSY